MPKDYYNYMKIPGAVDAERLLQLHENSGCCRCRKTATMSGFCVAINIKFSDVVDMKNLS
jgi:hypothetical protein